MYEKDFSSKMVFNPLQLPSLHCSGCEGKFPQISLGKNLHFRWVFGFPLPPHLPQLIFDYKDVENFHPSYVLSLPTLASLPLVWSSMKMFLRSLAPLIKITLTSFSDSSTLPLPLLQLPPYQLSHSGLFLILFPSPIISLLMYPFLAYVL